MLELAEHLGGNGLSILDQPNNKRSDMPKGLSLFEHNKGFS